MRSAARWARTTSLTDHTTVGGYYQTKQSFQFDNAITLNPGPNQRALDVQMDLPQNVGLGVANSALMDGRLLVGVDVLYKLWDEADLFEAVYDNQWVVQLGTQYSLGRIRLRAGYAWAENPIDNTPGPNFGGVIATGRTALPCGTRKHYWRSPASTAFRLVSAL